MGLPPTIGFTPEEITMNLIGMLTTLSFFLIAIVVLLGILIHPDLDDLFDEEP